MSTRFGTNLKYLRRKYNISQEELADKLGYKSFTTIQKWEDGTSEPNIGKIKEIADLFNMTIIELTDIDWRSQELIGNLISHNNDFDATMDIYKVKFPIYGDASCGYGAINESPEEYIDLEEHMFKSIRNRDNCFFMYARGKSMERAGVHDGALLLLNRQETLENGEVGLFTWNNEEYLKRFKRQGDVIMLLSETYEEGHEPIIVMPDDQFMIRAKLLKCITDFNQSS